MKKNLLIVLILLMAISITGCATQPEPASEGTEGTEVSDDFPSKPVKIVVAYSAGGGTDRSVRLIQPALEQELGVPVVVENVGGAGTEIGTSVVYREPADGYTILASNQPNFNGTIVMQDPVYEQDDFEIIIVQAIDPLVVLAKKDAPWDTFAEFIEDAKQNPGEYAISCTLGSAQHWLALYYRDKMDVDYAVVTYAGGGEASAAFLGDHVNLIVGDAFSRYDLRDDAKALGLVADKPHELWPEGLPLDQQFEEKGITIPNTLSRYGIYAVKKEVKEQYPERFEALAQAFARVAGNEIYKENAAKAGMDSIDVWIDGQEVQKDFADQIPFLEEELAKYFE